MGDEQREVPEQAVVEVAEAKPEVDPRIQKPQAMLEKLLVLSVDGVGDV
ncbi:hypothetical protein C1752_10199 [Acaryochloris thomasi RCC1774]|uniref:Uncharacterized protein n=1 Tax=Acaryochloris thomasi RCC1774 TaxID=1764569 RepID=A0A2W1JKD7_9CYAN|nr:hypothetical protein [Acaryochloris thomasi]PZD70684.1 hypothetical protein C1752_10199 [Acaryochloris thomasi RCC1774]